MKTKQSQLLLSTLLLLYLTGRILQLFAGRVLGLKLVPHKEKFDVVVVDAIRLPGADCAAGRDVTEGLCGLAGVLGGGGLAQDEAVGLGPHVSPPDADQGGYRNHNKRVGHCIPHISFSLG